MPRSLSTVQQCVKGSIFLSGSPGYSLKSRQSQVLRTLTPVLLWLALNDSYFVSLVMSKNT